MILTEEGQLFTFGAGIWGQLGIPEDTSSKLVPTLVSVPPKVSTIKGAETYSIVTDTEGIVYSCGFNEEAQLGLGDKGLRMGLTNIISLNGKNIKQTHGSADHSFALTQSGDVFAFGKNQYGKNVEIYHR